jgi:hypothetical protein
MMASLMDVKSAVQKVLSLVLKKDAHLAVWWAALMDVQ